jgi:hypothetical protein
VEGRLHAGLDVQRLEAYSGSWSKVKPVALGTNVNHTVFKDGWVCAVRFGAGRVRDRTARGRKGLWADPHPVPPWEWRKRK